MTDKNEFLEKMAMILEVEPTEISLETSFRNDVPYWDSLKGFGMIVILEEDYGKKITVEEFLECHTLGDLFSRIDS